MGIEWGEAHSLTPPKPLPVAKRKCEECRKHKATRYGSPFWAYLCDDCYLLLLQENYG